MRPLTPKDPDWAAVLDAMPAHSPFHRPDWVYLLERYLDEFKNCSFLIEHGAQRWVLPGMLHARRFGASYLSLPFGTHGGPVGPDAMPDALVRELAEELPRAASPWITVTPDPRAPMPAPTGWRTRTVETHVLDLSPGYAALFEGTFSKNLRNQVRKAEKMEVRAGRVAERDVLSDFLYLWQQNVRRHRLDLPFTAAFFGALFSQSWCRLYSARLRESVLAVGVVLVGKKQAHWWQGVVDHSAGELNPNRLLVARMIEDLCDEGIGVLDLGGSEGRAGLSQFKEAFGASAASTTQWRRRPAWAVWAR